MADAHLVAGESLRHFVFSTNEDQWCEVIAEGCEVGIEDSPEE